MNATSPLILAVLFVLAFTALLVAAYLEHRGRRRVEFDEKWSAFVDAMRGVR